MCSGPLFVGLVSLGCLFREEVPRVLPVCRAAGLGVVLLSTDEPYAAECIARKSGLLADRDVLRILPAGEGQEGAEWRAALSRQTAPVAGRGPAVGASVVVSSRALADFDEHDWAVLFHRDLAREAVVIAEVSLGNSQRWKAEVVSRLRRKGHCVAMVGETLDNAEAMM